MGGEGAAAESGGRAPGVPAVIRRAPRGATTGPPLERPGNGFGRPVRPGPDPLAEVAMADRCDTELDGRVPADAESRAGRDTVAGAERGLL